MSSRLSTCTCLAFLLVAAAMVGAARRKISCHGTQSNIPTGALSLYNVGLVNDTYNFDALIGGAYSAFGGVDYGEFLATLNGVKPIMNNWSIPLSTQAEVWNHTWATLAKEVEKDAREYLAEGDYSGASEAFHRACVYSMLSGRFGKLQHPRALADYRYAVRLFEMAIDAGNKDELGVTPRCQAVRIPFDGSWMHGYYCTPHDSTPAAPKKRSTLFSITGFDACAEMTYYDQATGMLKRGYNVLFWDGPGQGYTVRFNGLHFAYDWERSTSAALDFVIANFANTTNGRYIVWGESMGGYLAPRAFAFESRFAALVANGGVYDFYQGTLCGFPSDLRDWYFLDDPAIDVKLNEGFAKAAAQTSRASFFYQFGHLGFGGSGTLTSLWTLMQNYTLEGHMHRFAGRKVYVYNPQWDTLMGNQSEIFWAETGGRLANESRIERVSAYRGGGMHCGVGSTVNVPGAIHRWVRSVVPPTNTTSL